MPLKHLTETILVVLLAFVTIVTGVIVSTLPHIPDGFFPWVGIFVATVLYPALLYPILKSNRADYSFRALHFAPVTIVLGWMFIEIALLKEARLDVLHQIYTWGWSAPGVAITFLLLVIFCLQVIRRRVPRLLFLVLLFTPFLASAYASERYTHWDRQLAALLWQTDDTGLIAQQPGGAMSSMLSQSSKGEKNLTSSSVPEEEAWREKLRAVEQGKVHSISAETPLKGIDAAADLSETKEGVNEGTRIVAGRRIKLPKSGGEFEAMVVLLIAAYAAAVHQRAKRRMV